MKIKQIDIKSYQSGVFRNFFAKNKLLTQGILAIIGLFGLVTLFFMILGYGAHLNQIGQTSYIKNTVLQMANLDFSFVKNYTVGRLQEFDDIQMDIKFRHLQRIQYLREQALEDGLISMEIKNEEFPVKLTLNGKTHNAKISLTGLVAFPHLRDPMKWSFQVKVSGDDTFKGMKRFAMLRPATRGYMTDWLGFELMKERGLIGLRVDYVHLAINGKPIGIYYMEERFDKYLVENNSLREGILFKLDGEFSAYQESKLLSDPGTRAQLLMVKSMWRDMMAGELPPGFFFDRKKMAQAFALCDLMNNNHPLARQNIRFYFNPVTGLTEPIIREWETIRLTEVSNLRLFIEKPIPLSRHAKFVNDPILKLIYDNLEFKRHYIQEAEILSQSEFLDQLLLRNEDKINSLINKVYRTWPFYKLYMHKLYENQDYIHSVLFPKDDQLAAYFSSKDYNTLQLSLHNQQYLPVEVSHLSWRDSILLYPKTPIVLDTKEKEQPQLFSFQIPKRTQLPDDYQKNIKVHYSIYGLESRKRTIGVLPQVVELNTVDRIEKLLNNGSYSTFDFVVTDEKNEIISIPNGECTISIDLVIPANKRLEIEAGAQIDLVNGASIISYSPIYAKGQEEMPIRIISSDSSSRGVSVIQADQRSQLSYVIFDKIAGPTADGGMLQGAITFFESPVSINACTFSNGRTGKDYLHIRRSDFSLDHSLFKNIDGNALGVNYCSGVISNSSFVNIGQDGITIISSKLGMNQLFLNNIGDQGLLAKGNSQLTIRWSDIRHAEIGIAVSGQSEVRIFDTLLENNNVGISIYEENSEQGKAYINAERLKIKDSATPYQIEKGAKMILDGAPLGNGKNNIVDKIVKVLQ